MRFLILAILFSLAGCEPFSPIGRYSIQDSPKTVLKIERDSSFSFVLDFQNPYPSTHVVPEEYYFRTDGTWVRKGKNLILNSGKDSLQYDLYRITSAINSKIDSSTYEFYDIFKDRIPIQAIQSGNGNMDDLDNVLQYSTNRISDTTRFYFFGYRPVTIVNSSKKWKDYRVYVMQEYRPNWIKNMKFRIKVHHSKKEDRITITWRYLEEQVKKQYKNSFYTYEK
jgi:hypothetical protein